MAQYVEKFRSYNKKSILKMYSNKRYNLVINYARPKILKRKRDVYLKRPLKIKACIGSNTRFHSFVSSHKRLHHCLCARRFGRKSNLKNQNICVKVA